MSGLMTVLEGAAVNAANGAAQNAAAPAPATAPAAAPAGAAPATAAPAQPEIATDGTVANSVDPNLQQQVSFRSPLPLLLYYSDTSHSSC